MTEQETMAGGTEPPCSDRALHQIERTLDRLLAVADVDKVFGEPIRQGETTIIPAAEVVTGIGFGFGLGFGRGSSPSAALPGATEPALAADDCRLPDGGGGGGGGGAEGRPVAVVVATPRGVRVEPVIDFTKVALAALTAGGFMLATWLRMAPPKKSRLHR